MSRTAPALRLLVPALWLGMIVALSFLEAPLKFTAPGITTPLGLGIGRIMFNALTVSGFVLLAALTLLSLVRPRVGRLDAWLLGGMWAVLLVETLVIRPPLNARSDVIIAGGDPGPSVLHYAYIATEGLLVVLLAFWIVRAVRGLQRAVPAAERQASLVG